VSDASGVRHLAALARDFLALGVIEQSETSEMLCHDVLVSVLSVSSPGASRLALTERSGVQTERQPGPR
jgi:hypothetical protein